MTSWEQEFGGSEPKELGAVLGEVVDAQTSRTMSENQRAATAWYRANGDRERAHTVGVFLRRARVEGAAPIMGVYVDSHAMATDLGVNKDLYMARLANVGYAVSAIEFRVSRNARQIQEARAMQAREASREATPLPPLSPAEEQQVRELVERVTPALRESVSKAVSNSFRRQKLERAQSDQNG